MRYSIFSTDIARDIDLIERTKAFLYSSDTVEDFFIFTDEVAGLLNDHGSLPTFYIIGYRGVTIFLNVEDYLLFKDKTNGDIAIFLSKEDLPNIDRSIIKNHKIIIENEDSTLKWISYYGLQ